MRATSFLFLLLTTLGLLAQPQPAHNLIFSDLPQRWDEALPLGNGMLGCLIWQKEGRIRLSLDRADLWDLRPMKGLDRPEFRYNWVAEQHKKDNYGLVQQYFDAPYEQEAGPTKLPGAAIEFAMPDTFNQTVHSAHLDIATGIATILFSKGTELIVFVHAEKHEGWFRWANILNPPDVALIPPFETTASDSTSRGSVNGDGLGRLGYPAGTIAQEEGTTIYRQECWGGYHYEIAFHTTKIPNRLEGVWSISKHTSKAKSRREDAFKQVRKSASKGFEKARQSSERWWTTYWKQSSVRIPDTLLERQYYRDMYKFGCVARPDAPMISLQAVWTADNGRLPPWKGDFHHDLNTQMSYWPAYTANRLDAARGYVNHLEKVQHTARAYTRRYFGAPGLNYPGVATLDGEPMGGWIQYACSPTVSAWLSQHFYLQWRYSMNRNFLKRHAWPFMKETAVFLEAIITQKDGTQRVLPLSSSPEINDNSKNAWFPDGWTNYDLALSRFVFEKTAELALEIGNAQEAAHWKNVSAQLPPFSCDPGGALRFAPSLPYRESHRHFSHLMAIHPLGLIDWNKGDTARQIIRSSLALLDSVGSRQWTGYSFAWLANLRARAHDGAGAREALRIFAEAFVSPNSFHLNGDQSGKGYSDLIYHPFTLEGNFASAAGIQEMLLQSHSDAIEVFPAVPEDWQEVTFLHMRAEGGFLVNGFRSNGRTDFLEIKAERGGILRLRKSDPGLQFLRLRKGRHLPSDNPDIFQCYLKKGGMVAFKRR